MKAGGTLKVDGGKITGPVTVTAGALVEICDTQITGPLTVTGSTGLVTIGGDEATGPCDGNTITGGVTLTGNKAGVEFNGNKVTGPVTITGNTGSLPPPDLGSVHATSQHGHGPGQDPELALRKIGRRGASDAPLLSGRHLRVCTTSAEPERGSFFARPTALASTEAEPAAAAVPVGSGGTTKRGRVCVARASGVRGQVQ